MNTLWLIVASGALAIVYAIWATRSVLNADPGSERMQEIAAAVREGAQAYLKRQYSTIAVVGIVIFLIVGYFLGWLVAVGFAIGAILSGAAGFIGMNVSVRANVRTETFMPMKPASPESTAPMAKPMPTSQPRK